jgi:hypothetical protein
MAMLSGMEIMTTIAARQPKGSSVSNTSKMAMPKSLAKRVRRLLTESFWSKTFA